MNAKLWIGYVFLMFFGAANGFAQEYINPDSKSHKLTYRSSDAIDVLTSTVDSAKITAHTLEEGVLSGKLNGYEFEIELAETKEASEEEWVGARFPGFGFGFKLYTGYFLKAWTSNNQAYVEIKDTYDRTTVRKIKRSYP